MSRGYDSGGHHKDDEKYKDNYDKIFKGKWPCPECGMSRTQGHKLDCTHNWRNK